MCVFHFLFNIFNKNTLHYIALQHRIEPRPEYAFSEMLYSKCGRISARSVATMWAPIRRRALEKAKRSSQHVCPHVVTPWWAARGCATTKICYKIYMTGLLVTLCHPSLSSTRDKAMACKPKIRTGLLWQHPFVETHCWLNHIQNPALPFGSHANLSAPYGGICGKLPSSVCTKDKPSKKQTQMPTGKARVRKSPQKILNHLLNLLLNITRPGPILTSVFPYPQQVLMAPP